MFRSLIVPALAIASFVPLGLAQQGLIPVSPAIYHPGLSHQTWAVQVDYNYQPHARHSRAYYRNRRRRAHARYLAHQRYQRHRRNRTIKRVAIPAAGGAVVGALVGGGKGALIGAGAGAAAGAIYNHHENTKEARRY